LYISEVDFDVVSPGQTTYLMKVDTVLLGELSFVILFIVYNKKDVP